MIVNTIYKESGVGQYRAEIHKTSSDNYCVEYYSPSGHIKSIEYKNSPVSVVENITVEWINSIKVLNE